MQCVFSKNLPRGSKVMPLFEISICLKLRLLCLKLRLLCLKLRLLCLKLRFLCLKLRLLCLKLRLLCLKLRLLCLKLRLLCLKLRLLSQLTPFIGPTLFSNTTLQYIELHFMCDRSYMPQMWST